MPSSTTYSTAADLTDTGVNQKQKLVRSHSFKSGRRLGVRQSNSTDRYQIIIEVTRCTG